MIQNTKIILKFLRDHNPYGYNQKQLLFKNQKHPLKLVNNFLTLELEDRSIICYRNILGDYQHFINELIVFFEGEQMVKFRPNINRF